MKKWNLREKLIKAGVVISSLTPFSVNAGAGTAWDEGKTFAGSQGLPSGTLGEAIRKFAQWLLIVLGAFALIGFAISGILYLTAAGDEERMERAKRGMYYSIIGIIVGLAGLLAVNTADKLLGTGDATDF